MDGKVEILVRYVSVDKSDKPRPNPNKEDDKVREKSTGQLTIASSVLFNQAWKFAKSSIKNIATYQVGKYFRLTEDYINEMNLRNTMTIINKGATLLTSAIAGFKLGSVGGPIGSAIGTTIGVGAFLTNETINSIKSIEQQQIAINTANYTQAFNRKRAGLEDNGKGTLN